MRRRLNNGIVAVPATAKQRHSSPYAATAKQRHRRRMRRRLNNGIVAVPATAKQRHRRRTGDG
jgi:hypothetical protein